MKINILNSVTISVSLLSSHILYAQGENGPKAINQVTGINQTTGSKTAELLLGDIPFQINQGVELTTNYELPTTNCNNNQVTGYRVRALSREQGTENREQVRNTNQVTGCRLQGAGAEMVELTLDDQIRQRTKTTTNCELRTANCNNQGNNLDYYLMMDPVTSSTLEGGVKTLLSRFAKPSVYPEEEGAISAAVRVKPNAVNSNSSSDSKYVIPENSSVAAHEDAIEQVQGQIDGMTAAAREFETHFSQEIKRVKAEAEAMSQEAEEALFMAQERANRSEASEKIWNEVIDKAICAEATYANLVQFCMQYRNHVSEYYTGWMLDSKRMQYDLDQKKAESKQEYWTNVMENTHLNQPIAYSLQPTASIRPVGRIVTIDPQAPVDDRKDQIGSHFVKSSSQMIGVANFEESFDQKIEAAKAQAEEMTSIATTAKTQAEKDPTSNQLWIKAIEEATQAEKAYSQLLEVYKDYSEQVVSYYPADLVDITRVRYDADYKRAEIERNHWSASIMEWAIQKLQKKSNSFCQRLAILSEEVTVAQRQGEVLIAQGQQALVDKIKQLLSRIEKVTKSQQNGTLKITKAKVNNFLVEIGQLEQQDHNFQQNIPLLKACVQKRDFLQTHIAALKEKVSVQNSSPTQLIETQEVECLDCIFGFLDETPVQSSQNNGRQAVNPSPQKLLTDYQQIQPHIEEMVKQLFSGNTKVSKQAETLLFQINQLEQREQTLQAEESAKLAAEEKRLKEREECKKRIKEAKEKEQKAQEEYELVDFQSLLFWNWSNVAKAFGRTAFYWKKVGEAEQAGKTILAAGYREAAAISQKAVDQYKLSAERKDAGKESEGVCWGNAGDSLLSEADTLGKAIEAAEAIPKQDEEEDSSSEEEVDSSSEEEVGVSNPSGYNKSAIAQKYREVAGKYNRSVEFFTKAATAHMEGKTQEGTCWNNAGAGFYWVAEQLQRAIEADENSKAAIAQKYREAAEKNLLSVEPYTKAAIAHAAGKTEEGTCWNNAGNGFYCTADQLRKAIEADENNKPAIARKWREAAEKNLLSVEPCTKAAIAHAAGKTDEGSHWNRAGLGFYWATDKLGKAIEADEANKPGLAQKYREAAEKNLLSVEPFTKAVTAFAAGKTEVGTYWSNAGTNFYWAADQLKKAIEADENNQPEVAQQCREAAEKYILSAEADTQAVIVQEYRDAFRW
ncbi:MAG: hypothetical protein A3F67_07545 [Verrucomicrobia bacterium RIFCSPHIGHO2_12_FULL_41_10]|nr:MAG: hypothetical protein A3F67_07545 [Verrucomicrobia bacterium RIFCSPHIGHO2_12_FULL_41_10]